MHTGALFEAPEASPGEVRWLAPQACVLRGFALPQVPALLAALRAVIAQAPLRHMHTARGGRMSVRTTNCGAVGWISDAAGYRYSPTDPVNGQPWPALPEVLAQLGREAAAAAGFADFVPDACLVNRYRPGDRMGLHQDRNERRLDAPIVSVSLGIPALFLWGGARREAPTERVPLFHGDVAVWGGAQRLNFHGVAALPDGHHALLGPQRLNLTVRRAC